MRDTWRLMMRFYPTLIVCFMQLRFCDNKLTLRHLLHHQFILLLHLHHVHHHLVLLQLQVRHRLRREGGRRSLLPAALLSFRSSYTSWTFTSYINFQPNYSSVLEFQTNCLWLQTWRSFPGAWSCHCRVTSLLWCCCWWPRWHCWCRHW